ncbi:MAG: hypothetical protein UX10_C0018G0007 [Candidatus Magasanikbacteria bacterium GW2011_GWA2_45_39]|uniref:DUF3006 domain-containing protein n=1 Tax=Candidatus Magasanikbacteria bacterium GW2011_GWA2_45_39 TaxID=1619041 RepID=A0A0G1MF33_9BACT|nr:MAG: hypothetical protein UX10_C0018G0007 [Candidatus Magasanikbacteria bacterium GW2011_GWA2_45_39]HBW74394.1 DUF3006 domain-containing protein [Candidatus Magasanikbacteria bacterium]
MPDKKENQTRVFFATIDAIEEHKAVLELENKEIMNIPLAYMPDEAEEGERIKITCERNVVETEARETDAKKLLNDILHAT